MTIATLTRFDVEEWMKNLTDSLVQWQNYAEYAVQCAKNGHRQPLSFDDYLKYSRVPPTEGST